MTTHTVLLWGILVGLAGLGAWVTYLHHLVSHQQQYEPPQLSDRLGDVGPTEEFRAVLDRLFDRSRL